MKNHAEVSSPRQKRLALVAIALATSMCVGGGAAKAATPSPDDVLAQVDISSVKATPANARAAAAITRRLLAAPSLEAGLALLSDSELRLFKAYALPARETETSAVTAESVTSGAATPTSATLAVTTTCWHATSTKYTVSSMGNSLYSVQLQTRWCGTGGLTTASSPSLIGQWTQTYFPGWSWQGRIASGSGVTGGSAKTYVQNKFILSSGGWTVVTQTPCRRHVGFGNGTWGATDNCGIY